MKIKRTVYRNNLLPPDSYTVEIGRIKKMFKRGEERQAGEWIKSIWEEQTLPEPADIYYNIDWDSDHILYCTYSKED